MECQVYKRGHFRHLLHLAFNRGAKATAAVQDIGELYGEETMPYKTAQNLFDSRRQFRFWSQHYFGRNFYFDKQPLIELIYKDPRRMTRELTGIIECSYSTIEVQKLGSALSNSQQRKSSNTHSPYSPNLTPSHFHLFQFFSNKLRDVSFNDDMILKILLDDFLESKSGDFHCWGIEKLVGGWKNVLIRLLIDFFFLCGNENLRSKNAWIYELNPIF